MTALRTYSLGERLPQSGNHINTSTTSNNNNDNNSNNSNEGNKRTVIMILVSGVIVRKLLKVISKLYHAGFSPLASLRAQSLKTMHTYSNRPSTVPIVTLK